MKKAFAILPAATLVMLLAAGTLWATDRYVSTTGSNTNGDGTAGKPWQTIEYAIDHSTAGDVINVAAGTYNLTAPIKVTKAVTLTGDITTPSNVVINAPTVGPAPYTSDKDCFQVRANNVTIEGFRIQGAHITMGTDGWQNAGIMVGSDPGANMSGIPGPIIGIQNTVIQYNEITNNSYGIHVYRARHTTISHNKIYGNTQDGNWSGKGIMFYSQVLPSGDPDPSIQIYDVDILDNEIYHNKLMGIEFNNTDGVMGDLNIDVLIDGNVLYSNGGPWDDLGYAIDVYRGISSNGTADGSETGVTITNNAIYSHWATTSSRFSSGSAAIRPYNAKNWTISNNRLHDNLAGIRFAGALTTGNVVTGNEINSNAQGIRFEAGIIGTAYSNSIHDNNVTTYVADGYSPYGVANLSAIVFDASCNWWGSNDPTTVATKVSASVDYTPWLNSGTDKDPATPGFQGDFSTLWVSAASPQVGPTGRIQEGINLVTGSTVYVAAGTYGETIRLMSTTTPGISIIGENKATTFITGGIRFESGYDGLKVRNFTITGDGRQRPGLMQATVGTSAAANLVSNAEFSNNVFDGEGADEGGAGGGRAGLYIHTVGGSFTFDNNEVKNFRGWATIELNETYNIVSTYTFMNNNVHGNHGSSALRGSSSNRTDNVTVTGNTFDNNGNAAKESWAALEMNEADQVTVSSNTITNTQVGLWGEGEALQFWHITPTSLNVTGNIIANNYQGIYFPGGTWASDLSAVHINGNCIYENTEFGIKAEDDNSGTVDAKNNWWGTSDGPGDVGSGSGDHVSDNVTFSPWLTGLAYTGAPQPTTSVTLEATLSNSTPGGAAGATVLFFVEGSPVGTATADLSGVAAINIGPKPVGIYNVGATAAGGCLSVTALLAVYDPSAGFVTGGGWIWSLPGAYLANIRLEGKANFGFVSKYEKGKTVPTGNTEFQFQIANLNFKSTVYEWLVISGARAQYKGSGKINGAGDYSFMLTAIDGEINGGGGIDKFRIKIRDESTNNIVYDNQMNAPDNADLTTALGGGQIVIQKAKATKKEVGDDQAAEMQPAFVPTAYALYQCYPDPFNPTTTIRFDIPTGSVVTLKVYDVLGREVATLVDREFRDAGRYDVKFDASQLGSGIYFYGMTAELFTNVRKMLLLR